MAVQKVMLDGVMYSRHPKTATIEDENGKKTKITLGYSHIPVLDDKDAGQAEYRDFLNEMVEKGVLTWRQLYDGLYALVLQQHGKILREYTTIKEGKAFNLGKAFDLFRDQIDMSASWVEAESQAKKLWDEQQGDVSNWNAEEHQLFPKDISHE